MCKLYAQNIIKGWELIKTSNDQDEIELLAETINPKEYREYMIIEHSNAGDSIKRRQELYQECEVEYTNNFKKKYEVKAVTFKPSKMKQKEELRKMTEEYLKE